MHTLTIQFCIKIVHGGVKSLMVLTFIVIPGCVCCATILKAYGVT